MDTFFFILRKNYHQITVLHVYHHASMLNIWWFVMNWVPCGHCKSHVVGGFGNRYEQRGQTETKTFRKSAISLDF